MKKCTSCGEMNPDVVIEKLGKCIFCGESINKNDCPRCSHDLVKIRGKYGDFMGCTSYPRCLYSRKVEASDNLPPVNILQSDKSNEELRKQCDCPNCGEGLIRRDSSEGNEILCKQCDYKKEGITGDFIVHEGNKERVMEVVKREINPEFADLEDQICDNRLCYEIIKSCYEIIKSPQRRLRII